MSESGGRDVDLRAELPRALDDLRADGRNPTLAGVVFPYNVLVLCMSAMYEMWGDEMARRKPKNLKLGAVGVYVVRGPREDRRWYWQASCTVASKRKTIWSGWATKAEAERAACEARAALPTDLGTPDAQAKQEAEAGLTVAAVLERWMEDCYARPYISPRTLKAYRDAATNLTRLIGGYRLTEMSIVETQGYLNARHAEGLRVRTAWAELSIFRTAWRWGKAARLHDEPLHLPAEGREVFDVSGAGDTVAAALATALGAGLVLADAARLANAAAGIVVGKVGTAVASAGELFGALHAQELLLGERKVAGTVEAIDRVEAWRGRGLDIGFTNGVFDLLHPGHISLLDQAKAACDRLVVGLNSDASVRRIKGEGRPVQTEAARAAVLSSLSAVDLVVVFAEDTPVRLIEALRPDVLVKGADYAIGEVVGGDIVEGYGGKVLLADLLAGHSTTATIERLSN